MPNLEPALPVEPPVPLRATWPLPPPALGVPAGEGRAARGVGRQPPTEPRRACACLLDSPSRAATRTGACATRHVRASPPPPALHCDRTCKRAVAGRRRAAGGRDLSGRGCDRRHARRHGRRGRALGGGRVVQRALVLVRRQEVVLRTSGRQATASETPWLNRQKRACPWSSRQGIVRPPAHMRCSLRARAPTRRGPPC